MASQSESLGSQDSWSTEESPTTSDEEFIVSDSEMEEAEADEYLEDQFEQLFESFSNLKEEQEKLKKELKIQSLRQKLNFPRISAEYFLKSKNILLPDFSVKRR